MTVTKHFTKNSKKEKKATATQKDSHKEGMLELRKKMTSGRQSSELSEHGRVVEEKCLNHRNKDGIGRKTGDHRCNYRLIRVNR